MTKYNTREWGTPRSLTDNNLKTFRVFYENGNQRLFRAESWVKLLLWLAKNDPYGDSDDLIDYEEVK